MTTLSPPQAPPLFTHSADSLISRVEQLIACNKELTDAVVQNVAVDKAEFSNVLLPLAHGKNAMALDMNTIGFLRSVSPDSNIRDVVATAQKKMSDYEIESSMREDVFKLVEAVYYKQKDDPLLDAESRHLLEKDYRASIRMGLGLQTQERDRFKEIKKRLPELYIAFSKNLSEEKGGIWFKPEELNGVPDDVLETLAKGQQGGENEGKLRLTFKYPDLHPTMRYCTVSETRKKM
jgi:metallopeptidase MepB